jgi:hypothetical protein
MLRAAMAVLRGFRFFFCFLLLAGMTSRGTAQTNQTIYTDSLQNAWYSSGWGSSIDLGTTDVVYSGAKSISVTITSAWGGLLLGHIPLSSGTYSNLTFWINGGSGGGQQLQVLGHANGSARLSTNLPPLAANVWQSFTIPLAVLGIANRADVDAIIIMDRLGAPQPVFYLDDIALTTNSSPVPAVTLTSPVDGSSYAAPASIPVSASVVSNGHSMSKVQFYRNGSNLLNEVIAPPYSFTWTNVNAGIYSLTARAIYDSGAGVDSVPANVTVSGTTHVSITADAGLNRHAINPLIYGVAFASSNDLSDLNFPINRLGGNIESRYNWQLNAHNRNASWYFVSNDDGSPTPAGWADAFVANTRNGGAEPMITIPTIGWMPKLGPGRSMLASYSVAKYGPQMVTDPYWPDAGNGMASPSGVAITNNDPTDANFPTNSLFQQAYVQHLTNVWGTSASGGVRYYLLDNEPSIWFLVQQDVHPQGPTMQEILDKFFDYAGMIKAVDPSANVGGPEEWGWPGYFYSGYDQQNPGYQDRAAHGGWDYMPWMLDQIRQHDAATGQRLLDFFTLHGYPQGNGQGVYEFHDVVDDISVTAQLLRNRSTRLLWDTNYVDVSWIHDVVKLLPRMKAWVAAYYPGTRTGITEYSWGGDSHINGATAQADVLGIFGREGLDLATRWNTPAAGTPTRLSMKMFRNYDGNKSTFGDTSIFAGGPDPDTVSVFGAVRSSDGALTVMVINKQLTTDAALTMNLTNFSASDTAQVWQLTSANTITRLSDVSLVRDTLSTTVPRQSITLFVVPAKIVAPPPRPALTNAAMTAGNTFAFSMTNGVAGQRYIIEFSMDLVSWLPIQTNTLASSSTNLAFPVLDTQRFYRARWAP